MLDKTPSKSVHSGGNLRDGVGTTSQGLLAGLARPDADGGATDSVLAAEGASVAGVLGHFLLCGVVSNLMTTGRGGVLGTDS